MIFWKDCCKTGNHITGFQHKKISQVISFHSSFGINEFKLTFMCNLCTKLPQTHRVRDRENLSAASKQYFIKWHYFSSNNHTDKYIEDDSDIYSSSSPQPKHNITRINCYCHLKNKCLLMMGSIQYFFIGCQEHRSYAGDKQIFLLTVMRPT